MAWERAITSDQEENLGERRPRSQTYQKHTAISEMTIRFKRDKKKGLKVKLAGRDDSILDCASSVPPLSFSGLEFCKSPGALGVRSPSTWESSIATMKGLEVPQHDGTQRNHAQEN
jgi:hypothetical protein